MYLFKFRQWLSLRSLVVVLLAAGPVALPPAGHAQDQSAILDLKHKIIALQNKGELGFSNLYACAEIRGFGSYTPLKRAEIQQGGVLRVYYEPRNVSTRVEGGIYTVHFTQDMILLAADGSELFKQNDILNFTHATSSPVLDIFADNELSLGQLPPGDYVFKAILHDKIKGADAEASLAFKIVAAE